MGTGKKKIEIKRKEKETDRVVTFTKRRKGLFKKARQLQSMINGSEIAILALSPAGNPFIDPPEKSCFEATINKCTCFLGSASFGAATQDQENDMGCFGLGCDDHTSSVVPWLNDFDVKTCNDVGELIVLKMGLEASPKDARTLVVS